MQNPDLELNTLTNWPDCCYPAYASFRINTANQGWGLVETPDLSGLCTAIENNGGNPKDDSNSGSTCLKIIRDGR